MPIIPESQSPRTGRQSAASTTPGGGGTVVGRGLAVLGQGLQQGINSGLETLDAFAQLRDETEADKRTLEVMKFRTQMLSHPGDPAAGIESGLMNRSGESAVGATITFQERMDKRIAELEKGLSPRALQIFRASTYPEYDAALRSLSRHESEQVREARASGSIGLAQEHALQIATNFRSDDAEVEDRLAMIDRKMREASEGFSGENIPTDPKAAERFQENLSVSIAREQEKALVARASAAIAAGDVQSAVRVLETFGPRMNDASVVHLTDAIGGAYMKVAARDAVRVVVGSPGGSELGIRQSKDAAVAIVSRALSNVGYDMKPEYIEHIEKLTEAELDDRRADVDRAKEKRSEIPKIIMLDAIQNNVLGPQNPGYMSEKQVTEAWQEARADALLARDSGALKAVDDAYNTWRENPGLGGFAPISDQRLKAELNGMTDDELRSVTDTEERVYMSRLRRSDWEDFSKRRRDARNSKPTDVPVLTRDEIQGLVLRGLNDSGSISTRLVKSLNTEDAETLNRAMDLILIDAGPNPTTESVSKATANFIAGEFTRVGWLGGESEISAAEVLSNPNQARRIPGFMDEIEKLGYSEEQLENDFIFNTAVGQVLANRARRKRAEQLNQGPVKP